MLVHGVTPSLLESVSIPRCKCSPTMLWWTGAYISRVERAVSYVGLEIIGSWPTSLRWIRPSSSGGPPGPEAGSEPTDFSEPLPGSPIT